nr:LOW QUALITY PROTEIN: calcium-activated potassium channel subunit beta-2-like [Salvelinus alpinus]
MAPVAGEQDGHTVSRKPTANLVRGTGTGDTGAWDKHNREVGGVRNSVVQGCWRRRQRLSAWCRNVRHRTDTTQTYRRGVERNRDTGDDWTIYQKVREYDVLDKRKTVTSLKAGEDRAILLGLSMILFSVMMYFVLGITMVRSYSDSVWTEESSCTVLNSTIMAEINCTYSCGSECWKSSKYPCLQVFVSLNTSGKVVRLSHNEEAQDTNPKCFYVPKCRKDYNAMHTVIMNISERLKTQQQVLCYTDPGEQQESALLTRIYGRVAVFHSLFWPTCTLIGGTIIIAMVKLTQYLSIMCEQVGRIKR